MLQAGEDPSADVCGVCNHRHHQGTKCGICGHVGKSQIYHRMKSKAASYGTCKTDFYGLVPVMKDGNNPLYVMNIYCQFLEGYSSVRLFSFSISCGALGSPDLSTTPSYC